MPIGISDYKTIIGEGYYYVDKTDFIRQIIEEGSLITLLPRPRRFGKTLNLSMLRYFFERTEGNEFRPLFNGMQIEQWKDFDKYQGKYPVIMITLKDCKASTFEGILGRFALELKAEFKHHSYLLNDNLTEDDRRYYHRIMNRQASVEEIESSLSLLSTLLTDHWGVPPLVLLDEYDTPVHVAYDKGFYDDMIDFMRNFMSTVFKDNTDIFRGVITGILRVSKESLFSGLNNIDVDTLLDKPMSTAFGFTQEEVDKILADYSLEAEREKVKEWYDGFLFGGTMMYNPWSIINYTNKDGAFAPYWVNTGSDVLLRFLVANGPTNVRRDIATLIQGGTIKSVINDKLAFPDLLKSAANVWSFMLFSGYLKASADESLNGLPLPREYTLAIPNQEISFVFDSIIRNWIDDGPVTNTRLQEMLQALMENDIEAFEDMLNEFVVSTLSFYDTNGSDPEKVYQAFLLGLLISLSDYEISSNRESGLGRYDILLRPKDLTKRGYIMELKRLRTNNSVEEVLDSALRQINDRQYASTLRSAGVKDILKMAVTFDGKRVWVKTEEEK